MLNTLESTEFSTQPEKGKVRVGGNSRARHNRNEVDKSEIDDDKVDVIT